MTKKTLWIVLVLVVVVAGAYAVSSYTKRGTVSLPSLPDSQTKSLGQQGTADDVSAIEQDLTATDLSGLDRELQDIAREIGL